MTGFEILYTIFLAPVVFMLGLIVAGLVLLAISWIIFQIKRLVDRYKRKQLTKRRKLKRKGGLSL
jgi:hypothetical protein